MTGCLFCGSPLCEAWCICDGRQRWLYLLPCALTLAGLVAGLVGVALLRSPVAPALLVASLLLDCADGWTARRLAACSELGAHLDATVDRALSVALVWRACETPAAAAVATGLLVYLHTMQVATGRRVSGRAVVTVAVLLAGAGLRWWW